jgi:hypothetical protein
VGVKEEKYWGKSRHPELDSGSKIADQIRNDEKLLKLNADLYERERRKYCII